VTAAPLIATLVKANTFCTMAQTWRSILLHDHGRVITMNETASRIALYARVSSDHQAKAATIESQLSALEDRIAQNNQILEDELRFVDDATFCTFIHLTGWHESMRIKSC
jgi:TolA-binding protein